MWEDLLLKLIPLKTWLYWFVFKLYVTNKSKFDIDELKAKLKIKSLTSVLRKIKDLKKNKIINDYFYSKFNNSITIIKNKL